MTFGFREGVSTFDIRRSTDDFVEDEHGHIHPRQIYVRRAANDPHFRTGKLTIVVVALFLLRRHYYLVAFSGGGGSETSSNASSVIVRHQPTRRSQGGHGPFPGRNFRMIDSSSTDLSQPLDRVRRGSGTSVTSYEATTATAMTPTGELSCLHKIFVSTMISF